MQERGNNVAMTSTLKCYQVDDYDDCHLELLTLNMNISNTTSHTICWSQKSQLDLQVDI